MPKLVPLVSVVVDFACPLHLEASLHDGGVIAYNVRLIILREVSPVFFPAT